MRTQGEDAPCTPRTEASGHPDLTASGAALPALSGILVWLPRRRRARPFWKTPAFSPGAPLPFPPDRRPPWVLPICLPSVSMARILN